MKAKKNKLIGNCETTEKTPRKKLGIVEYWMQNAEELGLEESDFAHPNCFACGKPPSENFSEATRSTKATEGPDWNQKTPLQKAHVVPRSLGGNNEPRNCLLLCDVCHKECPVIKDRELVLRWVKNRPHYFIRLNRDIDEAFVQLGYPNWRDIKFFNDPKKFKNLLARGKADLTKEWTTNGPKISAATIAAVMVKQYEQFPIPLGNPQARPNLH